VQPARRAAPVDGDGGVGSDLIEHRPQRRSLLVGMAQPAGLVLGDDRQVAAQRRRLLPQPHHRIVGGDNANRSRTDGISP
jgi:hypothetical protein